MKIHFSKVRIPKIAIPLTMTVFSLGLLLFAGGIYLVYPPAALFCPGIILMAISIFGEPRK
jgi:hypothetical protein